jgi:predicted 3-demethylubiquinone-9 3-methyltransferase (glyoxalase superfamily)
MDIFLPLFFSLEVAKDVVELIESLVPRTAVRLEPLVELLEGLRAEAVDALLRYRTSFDEPGLAQHAEVLRDLGLPKAEPVHNLSDRARLPPEELDDLPAVGFRESAQGGLHGTYILLQEYSCQGIFGRTESKKCWGEIVQKIVTFLWFNDKAEEAMNFYVSVFKNSKILNVSRLEGAPGANGKVMTGSFQLEGQEFMALNGGPQFPFTEAVSLFVNCETQQEVDELWEKLSAGGSKDRCGWLKDKYGLSWQIIPTALGRMLGDKDPAKARRVMEAMLQMSKIDIAGLKRAYDKA